MDIGNCFTNEARVDGLVLEYDTGNNSSYVEGCIESADLAIDIIAIGADPEFEGDPVAFQIDYSNNGNTTGTLASLQAWITSEVFGPSGAGSTLLSSSLAGSIDPAGDGWVFGRDLSPIAPGEGGTIVVTGYLNSSAYLPGQPICLSGLFMSEYTETLDDLLLDNSDMDCHFVTGEIADLTIEKLLLTDLSTVEENDPVTYQINYANVGNDVATDVTITDTMPVYLDNFQYPAGCTVAGQIITCSIGNIAQGANDSIEITGFLNMSPNQSFSLTNTGEISHPGREFNTGNNLTGRIDIVPGLPDLWITKEAIGDQPGVP